MPTPFNSRLRAGIRRNNSRLCLGLDLDPGQNSPLHDTSPDSLRAASRAIVEATCDRVWGYKLNLAFFERFGSAGYAWLEELAAFIRGRAMVIGDGKRGDIGNSARGYAEALFQHLGLDAATVNPYMGRDALEPFIADPERGAFVLCLTSNAGAADLQWHGGERPLHLEVAAWARSLNKNENVGLVVGATHPDHLAPVRKAAPELPFLMPGVGAQGGALGQAVQCGTPEAPSIITLSRGLLYAGGGSLEEITMALDRYNHRINELVNTNEP